MKVGCNAAVRVTWKQISTMLRSFTAMFLIYRNYTFKSKSSAALCVDSDSDDEPLKRSVAHSQRLCNIQSRDQQQLQEEPEKVRENPQTLIYIDPVCAHDWPVLSWCRL